MPPSTVSNEAINTGTSRLSVLSGNLKATIPVLFSGDPSVRDAVKPMINDLNSVVEETATALQRIAQSRLENGDSRTKEDWSRTVAPGLLCADALLSLAESISETVQVKNTFLKRTAAERKQALGARNDICSPSC